MCYMIVAEVLGAYMSLGEGVQFIPLGFLEMTFMWGLIGSSVTVMQRPRDLRGTGTTE